MPIFVDNKDMIGMLDNPIWWALNSDSQQLGSGTDNAKIFQADVSPFAAVRDDQSVQYDELASLLDNKRVFVMFSPKPDLNPAPFRILNKIDGLQMVYERTTSETLADDGIVTLNMRHVPQMLALTQLVPPGPFEQRTITFGGYCGIFHEDQLVAMAGERLRVAEYTEISAVCTHTDFAGKGLAKRLMIRKIQDIIAAGKRPYLHVRADNVAAIGLYERLGFVPRSAMNFYVLQK